MAKRKKKQEEGAPLWVLTYGDMMSLLLVFFIMLVALSEIPEQDRFKSIMEEIKQAFGMHGGGGKLPTDEDPELSLIQILEQVQLQQQREPERSNVDDPGIDGRDTQVTQVREGLRFLVGGHVTFEPGSADLTDMARRQLRQVADLTRGYENIIELRGHAAASERELVGRPGDTFGDLWLLSYARAHAVMQYLTSDEVGIRWDRIRLIGNADREPLVQRRYAGHQTQPNRRVEVLVTESLVAEFTEPSSAN
ncbi:flagellar motor protein MotB [Phycisphaerales bacterium AB-hyl4]|uniref:Flagellar motor protein MotB n=1 Tax=Natronomicrosphaera hydrolytica TaxID=3242702 RepID=A0ABV4U5R1_9BACT